MTDIPALIARVGALTGPDRDVDRAILAYLGFSWRGMNYWHHDNKTMWPSLGGTFFTESVDDAMALVERVLPGYDWGRQDGFMFVSDGDDFAQAKHDLPAVALVLAALKALHAQEADRG